MYQDTLEWSNSCLARVDFSQKKKSLEATLRVCLNSHGWRSWGTTQVRIRSV